MMSKSKIGLYFGSFNPIHIGHLIIANHLVQHSNLDKVWFVITPMSPFKKKKSLLHNQDRLQLVEIALEPYENLEACTIEFGMPQPNYTIHTLTRLEEKYKQYDFSLIMGQDNLNGLYRWKNYERILEQYTIYVYPRVTAQKLEQQNTSASCVSVNHDSVFFVKAPIIELSATQIRNDIATKKEVRPLLPPKVWEYIDKNLWYL